MADKARASLILDEDFPLLRLMRGLFIGSGAPYGIDDFADHLGLSSHSLYKMIEGERPLRADVLLSAIIYINKKNRSDVRLLDYVAGTIGRETRLITKPRTKRVMDAIEEELTGLFAEDRQ